jgi:transcriptional regulator with XRE-family HTH domain
MSSDEVFDPQLCSEEMVELGATAPRGVLHRLGAVRKAKKVPRRVLAEQLGITVEELRNKEASADLTISTLCHWASTLNVPVTELVVEPDESLAPTRMARSQAARLMTVAAKLRDRSRRRGIQRLAQTFVEQLAEILPSLEELAQKNHRHCRRPNRQPPATVRPMPEHIFTRPRDSDER